MHGLMLYCVWFVSFREHILFIPFSFPHMKDRKRHSHSEKNTVTDPKESLLCPCGEQKLLHKSLCNRAASQSARQSAALVWGERSNNSANSTCCTANWPHVTTALIPSMCFFLFFLSLSNFSHLTVSVIPHPLSAVWWNRAVCNVLIEAAGGHAVFDFFRAHMLLSVPLATFRSISVYLSPCQLVQLFACPFLCLLLV